MVDNHNKIIGTRKHLSNCFVRVESIAYEAVTGLENLSFFYSPLHVRSLMKMR